MCIWGEMMQFRTGLCLKKQLFPLSVTAIIGSLSILLFITVRLKDLLVIFPPLKERRAQFGVGNVQASEYCCFPRLQPQSLWGRQDHCPVWKKETFTDETNHEVQLTSAAGGPTPSLTEHFDLGVDGNVAALHWAGVDALIDVGDISDLKTAVGEQVDSGIC